MIWRKVFERAPDQGQILYEKLVESARQEKFYRDWGVPDTIDGRFDMIVLHLFLVQDRLKQEGEAYAALQQNLTDTFFKDMDRSLREMGVGDLSVGKKVRKMAEACYGRLQAYAGAVNDGATGLQAALARNIMPEDDAAEAAELARWTLAARDMLILQPAEKIATGEYELP